MDIQKRKDFAMRVSQVNRTGLVAVTLEIIDEYIDSALVFLEKGSQKEYRTEIKQAQRFLGELMHSLDFKYPLAVELLRLYEYVQRILVSSDVSGTDKGLASARKVMSGLGEAFSAISVKDESGSVMENSQKIYAGLTYGKGTLNEADIDSGVNRGFLA